MGYLLSLYDQPLLLDKMFYTVLQALCKRMNGTNRKRFLNKHSLTTTLALQERLILTRLDRILQQDYLPLNLFCGLKVFLQEVL